MDLEGKTVAAMIALYCRGRHGTRGGLCAACAELLAFALERNERCPFGRDKPTCERCEVHCYPPAARARIREVMRYAGPRMLVRHPLLAVRHLSRALRYSGKRSK